MRVLSALLLFFAFSPLALADSYRVQISGNVVDEDGAPVAGARVALEFGARSGSLDRFAVLFTNSSGFFSIKKTVDSSYEDSFEAEVRACVSLDGYVKKCVAKYRRVDYSGDTFKHTFTNILLATSGSCKIEDANFENDGGGCRDLNTGLIWGPRSTKNLSWANAAIFCDTSELNGFTDWRLPTKSDLVNVAGKTKAYKYFRFHTDGYFWSADSTSTTQAPLVRLSTGAQKLGSKRSGYYVTCVRD